MKRKAVFAPAAIAGIFALEPRSGLTVLIVVASRFILAFLI
ncbi:MAG: hypothetical protein WB621_25015 [Candidatus Acidiferrales bacterium]